MCCILFRSQACALYFKLAADASLSRCYRDSLLLVAALASQYCKCVARMDEAMLLIF
jgi:hypothetical protein